MALARKLAVIPHRMWVDGTTFGASKVALTVAAAAWKEKHKVYGRLETPAFPKRSSRVGMMDEARPQSAPWLTTTRS